MKITIVPDKEQALGKATAIAATLKRLVLIQTYALNDKIAGVDVELYPPIADCVKDQGGWQAYENAVLQRFTVQGFKRYIPEPVDDENQTA